ncbi:hypothetical protein J4466_00225 [Candidatus Pacearchaeota archaeon]|nr:hypothetical protein [Candidatus Pacearchaeota archaeon]
MENGKAKLGKLEIGLDQLAKFIVKAKKNCYAGNGQEERLRDGSKVLTFQDGDFHYTDNYAGFYQAPGTEIVRWQKADGQRLWQMSYHGRMLPEFRENEEFAKLTFRFLKLALSEASQDKPFRGPEWDNGFRIDDWRFSNWLYKTKTEGNLTNFRGKERIFNELGNEVFSQDYIGGLVIPKD